ncbi:MAG: cation transporter [Alistipes sp.]|nr:cation transporter [Alistipes sp.]
MKKFLVCVIAALAFAGVRSAEAKEPQKKSEKTVVLITDVDCEHCKAKIMNNVPSLGKGVKDVKVDVPTKLVTVTYDESKNSVENIIKGLASLRVKASPAESAKK